MLALPASTAWQSHSKAHSRTMDGPGASPVEQMGRGTPHSIERAPSPGDSGMNSETLPHHKIHKQCHQLNQTCFPEALLPHAFELGVKLRFWTCLFALGLALPSQRLGQELLLVMLHQVFIAAAQQRRSHNLHVQAQHHACVYLWVMQGPRCMDVLA